LFACASHTDRKNNFSECTPLKIGNASEDYCDFVLRSVFVNYHSRDLRANYSFFSPAKQ
jgi:hypothetical protein